MDKEGRRERHLHDSCCRLPQGIETLEKMQKRQEFSASTMAFISYRETLSSFTLYQNNYLLYIYKQQNCLFIFK